MINNSNKDVLWNSLGCGHRAVRGTCRLFVLMVGLLTVVGCAAPGTSIRLAQLNWGRNLSVSRDKAPKFDAPMDEGDDVTVVDPDAEGELERSKEPRKLFGFGGNRAAPAPNRAESKRSPTQERAQPQTGSWWSTSPNGSLSDGGLTADEKRRQQEQFADAEALYKEGHLEEAEKRLKPLSKKKTSFWKNLNLLHVDSGYQHDHNRVREDSLFLLAESHFEQERFGPAKNYYEALLKDYPSTRHLNTATKRLFKIARTWLGFPEFATSDNVTQVNLEDPRATELPPREKPPHSAILVPNLTDRTRPTFDTPGHALEALKAIWLYDPRGPLADDAIMLTASHHFRTGNYQDADRYFSMLREEYPNSPHLQTSFVLGSHVKLMSYQGAAYDEKQLEDARLLKESTLRLFPNLSEKSQIKSELARIEEARAQRLWGRVEFYRRKGRPAARVIYAEELVKTYPNSTYAAKARDVLSELKPEALETLPKGEPSNFQRPTNNAAPTPQRPVGGPYQRPIPPQQPGNSTTQPKSATPKQLPADDEPPTADPNRRMNLPINFQRPRPNNSNAPANDVSGRAVFDSPE